MRVCASDPLLRLEALSTSLDWAAVLGALRRGTRARHRDLTLRESTALLPERVLRFDVVARYLY